MAFENHRWWEKAGIFAIHTGTSSAIAALAGVFAWVVNVTEHIADCPGENDKLADLCQRDEVGSGTSWAAGVLFACMTLGYLASAVNFLANPANRSCRNIQLTAALGVLVSMITGATYGFSGGAESCDMSVNPALCRSVFFKETASIALSVGSVMMTMLFAGVYSLSVRQRGPALLTSSASK